MKFLRKEKEVREVGSNKAEVAQFEMEKNLPIPPCLRDSAFFDPKKLVSEYKFRLEHFSEDIEIKIYKRLLAKEDIYEAVPSHILMTPIQKMPHPAFCRYGNTEEEALAKLVTPYGELCKEAIEQGHEPDDDWLWQG